MKYGLTEDDLDLLGTGTAEEIDARAKRLADRLGAADKGRRTPTDTLGRTDEGDQKVDVKAIVDSIPSTA